VFFATEIAFVAVRTGGAGWTFGTLRTLLALDALRTLQALDALRSFGTGRPRIAFRATLTRGSRWTDTGGTWRTDRAGWTGGTDRPGGTREAGRTAFSEQLGGDLVRVDGTARFDRLQSTIVIADARFDLV
jgi:hypothetical protein